MKQLLSSLAVFSLVAVAVPAVAQEAMPRMERAQASISEADFVARRTQALRAADANGDGQVSAEERLAQRQKMRSERMEARFTRLDTNADGQISREEFMADHAQMGHMSRTRGEGARHNARRMAGHGAHQRGEGRMQAMADRTVDIASVEQKARESFARMDANRDGQLSAEERRAARQTMRESRRGERTARQPSPSMPVSE